MTRDWRDFKSIYGNLAGAREGFEDACETLFKKIYPDKHVSQVAVKLGDGGIDIFIGEIGVEPITVIQCKFFLEKFEEAQKSQIRKSFKVAVESDKYELKEWILCIPRIVDIDESSWWSKWKNKKASEYSKDSRFIKIINGNSLIDLMKEHNIYNEIFRINDSLKIVKIEEMVTDLHTNLVPSKVIANKKNEPNTILFNNYSSQNEPFYLERNQDTLFIKNLNVNNIWIFGESGKGKTALINRNLIQNKIKYLFCDLSPITINNADDVLNEIIYSIEDEFNLLRSSKEQNKIKLIASLLTKCPISKRIIIVIDELSIDDISLLKKVSTSLINLVTHYNNCTTKMELRFVISTIAEPKAIIVNKSKASDYFQYIDINCWETYLEQLFELIILALNLNFKEKDKDFIIAQSQNSPRILKNIFRKIVATNSISSSAIRELTNQTIEELF